MSETPEEVAERESARFYLQRVNELTQLLRSMDYPVPLSGDVDGHDAKDWLNALTDAAYERGKAAAEERVRKAEEERRDAQDRAMRHFNREQEALAEIERLERILAAVRETLTRMVSAAQGAGRAFPGSLHAEEEWCDCAYCDARSVLAAEQARIRERDTSAILDHLGFDREEGA